mmetsp:Transcript_22312/g.75744  ORF Transcript_22312/g.75744 Transcript_22312/m.75744 type:complete len:329 (-) Transcript_22312:969-1955(-)
MAAFMARVPAGPPCIGVMSCTSLPTASYPSSGSMDVITASTASATACAPPNSTGSHMASLGSSGSPLSSSSAPSHSGSACSLSGNLPALTSWAVAMMALPSLCRYTFFSATLGTASTSRSSPSTLPGPTDGSWSASPTTSRCACFGSAEMSAPAIWTSSMDASSRMTTSHPRGFPLWRANLVPMPASRWSSSPQGPPSSRRCTVDAGLKRLLFSSATAENESVRRWAARPVGAHSATFLSLVIHILAMSCVTNVLPVPGPPVMSMTGEFAARTTASTCSSESFHEFCSSIFLSQLRALSFTSFERAPALILGPRTSATLFSARCSVGR